MDPSDLVTAMAAACSMFHEKEICPLGFSRRGELIGERATSKVGPPSLTIGRRGQGLGRAPGGEPGSLPPFVSSSVFTKLR
jgi:hypothetical protein